jgi:hypothetical protein
MTETERALRLAEEYGDASEFAAYGLSIARWARGTALLNCEPARRSEALELLRLSREFGRDVAVGPIDAPIAAARRWRGDIDDELVDSLKAKWRPGWMLATSPPTSATALRNWSSFSLPVPAKTI